MEPAPNPAVDTAIRDGLAPMSSHGESDGFVQASLSTADTPLTVYMPYPVTESKCRPMNHMREAQAYKINFVKLLW